MARKPTRWRQRCCGMRPHRSVMDAADAAAHQLEHNHRLSALYVYRCPVGDHCHVSRSPRYGEWACKVELAEVA